MGKVKSIWAISESGEWHFAEEPSPNLNPVYVRDLPRYLTLYDRLFARAKAASEFDFILALVHKPHDSHSDPQETTQRFFRKVISLHEKADDYDVEVVLALWLYGHIVESAYPYQIVADLVGIASGHPHRIPVFQRDPDGGELSPGRKLSQISLSAKDSGLRPCLRPLRESWNAPLRNSIFHSNYSIVGDRIRLVGVGAEWPVSLVVARANRSIAAFEALLLVEEYHRRKYTAPIKILAPVYFAHEPGTTVTVVVREGFGPVAIHSTVKDFDVESPVILGRMTRAELGLVNQGVFLLPPGPKQGEEG